ncbi:MAG: 23S rRNA (pseudouridine(1915)-N(3))-methyltransferase RlmH [Clostridia bacterium]|nr:23S rRNA (pseudouridine(1915)-N(3))-methyltransferase RlmH [Clostridia bacterium]
MKCTVLCTGSLKEKYWREAEQEYTKRMSRFGGWNVVELPEVKLSNNPSENEIRQALTKEGEALLKRLTPHAYTVALCVEGKTCSSEGLAQLLERIPREGKSELILIIGSSHGLAPEVKAACNHRLSVSPMTFPHQMMRVILAEQFYRAHKINAHENYHK